MKLKNLNSINLKNKTVLLRSELNVPLKKGQIMDDTRIIKSLETINYLIEKGAKIIICAHLGRPKGKIVENLKLDLVAKRLEFFLNKKVKKLNEIISQQVSQEVAKLAAGEIILLENIRFSPAEEQCEEDFSKQLASLSDVFVSDAFGALHRKHSSTFGVAQYLPAYAGKLVEKEVSVLTKIIKTPQKPLVFIVGGAKMETKISVIEKFLEIADKIIIGVGIANTFLKAQNHQIGESLYEEKEIKTAQKILEKDTQQKIYLPTDFIVAEEISTQADSRNTTIKDINPQEKILDIGKKSIQQIENILQVAKTIVWNGPIGLFEFPAFAQGTFAIANFLAKSQAYTFIGGGDTAEAVLKVSSESDFSHISTGGGASLKFLEGKILPGLEVLLEK